MHAGELLTLRGSVASGALSLLRALHGTSPRIRAEHHSAPHVQLRRATISASSALGIESGWRDLSDDEQQISSADIVTSHTLQLRTGGARGPRGPRGPRSPVVYLLRVRTLERGDAAIAEPFVDDIQTASTAWHEWAKHVRDSGGAVVLAVQTPLAAFAQTQTRPTVRGARLIPTLVRERVSVRAHNIRTLTLHAGQFVSAGPDERLPC